jgi:hypothetical protein
LCSPDLINLAPLRETAQLIGSADKLEATIALINNADSAKSRRGGTRGVEEARTGDRTDGAVALWPIRDGLARAARVS